jgi:hypothetical protein
MMEPVSELVEAATRGFAQGLLGGYPTKSVADLGRLSLETDEETLLLKVRRESGSIIGKGSLVPQKGGRMPNKQTMNALFKG